MPLVGFVIRIYHDAAQSLHGPLNGRIDFYFI
jgi:hypothetical protein